MSLREAAQQALEALERADKISGYGNNRKAITTLRAALSEEKNENTVQSTGGVHSRVSDGANRGVEAVTDCHEKEGNKLSPPYALILADRFEGFSIDHDPQGWPAIRQRELLKAAAELRSQHEEIERLNNCLMWEQHRVEHVGTHGPGCAEWGPKHYECLLRAHKALKAQINKREPLTDCGDAGHNEGRCGNASCITPIKREPLTIGQLFDLYNEHAKCQEEDWLVSGWLAFAAAIERAHGIGGGE